MICDECETVAHCTSHGCIPKQPTQQKPVATVTSESGNPDVLMSWWHEPALPIGTKLYTSPPSLSLAQRKPLTDEQISDIWCRVSNTDFVTADTHEFARAIEAAYGIKEKNSD